MDNNYLNSLNNQQKTAVGHFEGPLLILAGAGSGKTKVLTTRVANLIFNKKCFGQQILCVTFTNKAANEMRERVLKLINNKSKIKFELNNSILISKLIDGKFPNYIQVIPRENQKKLEIDLKSFLNSVDRVASVSLDKKDGVKFNLTKDNLDLSVNNTNSGDGKESLSVKFETDLDISFNSRYLLDIASQLNGDNIEIYLKDTGSPALIKDPADFDSIYVVMPMKG